MPCPVRGSLCFSIAHSAASKFASAYSYYFLLFCLTNFLLAILLHLGFKFSVSTLTPVTLFYAAMLATSLCSLLAIASYNGPLWLSSSVHCLVCSHWLSFFSSQCSTSAWAGDRNKAKLTKRSGASQLPVKTCRTAEMQQELSPTAW